MRKLLATIGAVLVLALGAAPLPATADPYVDNAAIDELFEELRLADNEIEADQISRQIWTYWFTPSDSKLATRMSVAGNFIGEGDLEGSLDELNGIVAEYPDYAEGWNQRATVNYMLAGRVLIYLKQGKHDAALADMIAALAIHPYLSERRFFPELAQDVTHV